MTDTLRLEVVKSPHYEFQFQVKVYVNEVDLTEISGSGMDPFEILVPVNRLAAMAQPHTVQFACCGACGRHECWPAIVEIRRSGDLVHWSLSGQDVPEAATFAAEAYEAEVARAAADQSWETPARTVWRLVLLRLAEQPVLPEGLLLASMLSRRGSGGLVVELGIPDRYQIWLDFPWDGGDPGQCAEEVCAMLARPAGQWPARWHSVRWGLGPPEIAGPSWRWEDIHAPS